MTTSKHKTGPLTPHDWIKAGFRLLTAQGASGLKAEVIARKLRTTKGSFYWHFKDVPAFHAEMLRVWEMQATADIMHQIDEGARSGNEKLELLSAVIARLNAENDYGGLDAEPAIRQWAKVQPVAAKALQKVDRIRIAFVQKLFEESGSRPASALTKAEIFYATFVGLQTLASIHKLDIAGHLRVTLSKLLED